MLTLNNTSLNLSKTKPGNITMLRKILALTFAICTATVLIRRSGFSGNSRAGVYV
jgi:hypothetical protein